MIKVCKSKTFEAISKHYKYTKLLLILLSINLIVGTTSNATALDQPSTNNGIKVLLVDEETDQAFSGFIHENPVLRGDVFDEYLAGFGDFYIVEIHGVLSINKKGKYTVGINHQVEKADLSPGCEAEIYIDGIKVNESRSTMGINDELVVFGTEQLSPGVYTYQINSRCRKSSTYANTYRRTILLRNADELSIRKMTVDELKHET